MLLEDGGILFLEALAEFAIAFCFVMWCIIIIAVICVTYSRLPEKHNCPASILLRHRVLFWFSPLVIVPFAMLWPLILAIWIIRDSYRDVLKADKERRQAQAAQRASVLSSSYRVAQQYGTMSQYPLCKWCQERHAVDKCAQVRRSERAVAHVSPSPSRSAPPPYAP